MSHSCLITAIPQVVPGYERRTRQRTEYEPAHERDHLKTSMLPPNDGGTGAAADVLFSWVIR